MNHCKNPKCRLAVTPNRSGRPKEYCGKRCRDAAYRLRSTIDVPQGDTEAGYAALVAAEFSGHARLIALTSLNTGPEATRALLRLWPTMQSSAGDMEAAMVRRARHAGLTTAEIAEALGMSAQRLRKRWPLKATERRMRRRVLQVAYAAPLSQTLRGPEVPTTTPRAEVLG